ncbi:hypothetical protein [Flavobacterium sp.]|uniref:hypothetical protein n=1 Tax=Flavobacterium sp. TaxID=239 RepID=UPI001217D075|nr:hypothetical protein [Flavobacterium sp.]RZJ70106.1 MAG: hypothetical protein EOO49_14850 [Flavobacterium sp.]
MTMPNPYITMPFGIAIIVGMNLLGHYLPPISLFTTPFYLTLIVVFLNKDLFVWNFHIATIFAFLLLLFNDLSLRLYAGGSHDLEGKGLCSAMSGMSFLIICIAIFIKSFQGKKPKIVLLRLFTLAIAAVSAFILYAFFRTVSNCSL